MAATMPPAFGLQQPEDTMEISSEYGNMDADIDIDLDDQPDNKMSFVQDDQQMLDDPKSDRPDDLMLDDAENTEDNDRIMQDDAPPQEQDEELLDFSDGEDDIQIDGQPQAPQLQPQPQSTLQPDVPVNPSPLTEEPIEQVQSEVATELLTEGVEPVDNTVQQQQAPEDLSQSQPNNDAHKQDVSHTDVASEQVTTVAPAEQSQTIQAEPETPATVESVEAPLPTETSVQENVAETTEVPQPGHDENAQSTHAEPGLHQYEQGNDENIDPAVQHDDEEPSHPTLTHEETEASAYTEAEDVSRERQANSPTVTGLHQTIVEYDGNEIYLFPSRDPVVSEQYLLDNENLVTTSLGDLLQACRTALGDGLTEDEELVLGVEELDLYVSEDSTPAFSTSFSELLDIYLQLHKLDGNDNPLPFRVTLTTKTRFTNRLTSITQAISEGKGFSQLPFLQYYQYDEPTELPDDDFDDEFEEPADHFDAEQPGEEDKENVKGAQDGVHGDNAAQDQSVQKHQENQTEQSNPSKAAEGQEGDYEGEAHAQHDESAAPVDESEPNQDETQYFDAQGDVPEEAAQGHESHEHHESQEGEAEVTHDEANAENGEQSYEEYHDEGLEESSAPEQNEQATGTEDHYEEQPEEYSGHDNGAEEHHFGQGEFFDENNYEYQEGGAAHEDQEEGHVVEEAGEAEAYDQAAQTEEVHETDEEHKAGSGENAEADQTGSFEEPAAAASVIEDARDEHQDTQGEENAADDGVKLDDEDNFLDGVDYEDSPTHTATEAADDDFDEINFDDEDDFEEQESGLAPETADVSSKTSPGGKRSFSELEGVDDDDEQDSKKARAS